MKLNLVSLLLPIFIILSCSSQDSVSSFKEIGDKSAQSENLQETSILTAKTIEDENIFIDVDMEALGVAISQNIQKPLAHGQNVDPYANIKKLYPTEFAMSRAAWHRYFSHGKMVDNIWISSVKKGADINMSERTFKFLQDDIDKTNKQLKEGEAMGYTIAKREITQAYLDNLLK